ncbi:TolC family protein [Hankyongella ginsenosidimutans]|uniref:TolC family protein n=1 Tax=Hankyongella ginsenosidimutans TaxID=1763828 RepID=UPI001CA30C51|nr:TolC family protein [Hankyongella ginsenosidimutans]
MARSSALALEALLGLNPGGLSDLLSSQIPIPLGAAAPTLSAPLTVVASRPDLKAAELRLAATGYTVTAAQRDRWPKLSLSGIVGAQTYAPESLFAGPGLVRSAAAEFTAPLFNFGRTRAAINAAKAQQAIAAETYAQAVVDALSEVERALNELGAAQGESETLAKAVAAAAQETALARSRYTAGLSPLLNVLTAEQGLLDAQSRLASAQARTGNALIALNTAMGRGV